MDSRHEDGEYGGLEVLTRIIDKNVPLGEAYDRRDDPSKVLSLGGQKNIEPLVSEWHKAKKRATKGAGVADIYLGQVRRLINEGQPFLLARFTIAVIKAHLLALDVPHERTRNRPSRSQFAPGASVRCWRSSVVRR